MKDQNWPQGVNFANNDWKSEVFTPRQRRDTYEKMNDERIPPLAYVWVALFLAAVFGIVPLVGWLSAAVPFPF